MRTLLLGLDAFDPVAFERLASQGKLPHLARYVEASGYARFGVANPSQSEVSWTSIATGLNPGGHGIFDFVHRDPATYAPYVSLLPVKKTIAGTQFVPPFNATTIFDQVVDKGYPATALWFPATFPARLESPVRTLPGLGTPDIQGKLGVGSLHTNQVSETVQVGKTPHEPLKAAGKNRYSGSLKGPKQQTRGGVSEAQFAFELEFLDDENARIKLGQTTLELKRGEWSPIFEVTFKMGMLVSVKAITRVILTETKPNVRLYFLPLQLHPLHSPWHYGTPGGFVKESWQANSFLTVGWPQDTTGLEDGCMTDDQFLALCDSIDRAREIVLLHHLKSFREGVLGIVFDTLDRVQHMFWRDRPDIVDEWYIRLDGLVSRVETALNSVTAPEPALFFVISDHGFARFDYKAHLNRWLQQHNYLSATTNNGAGKMTDIDWTQTRAYALGLNSLYLNLQGREGKGIVTAGERAHIENQLRDELLHWQAPNGANVVSHVWRRNEVLEGKLLEYAPDIIVGYAPGYRASQETGLGQWDAQAIEPNRDHWGADHCIDATAVPGVLFASTGLAAFPNPTYRDIPALTIDAAPDPNRASTSRPYTDEDQEIVEERLRSLGYL